MGKARALGDGPASLHVPRVIVKIETDIQIRSPCLDMRCHMAASVNLKQVRCRPDAKLVEIGVGKADIPAMEPRMARG